MLAFLESTTGLSTKPVPVQLLSAAEAVPAQLLRLSKTHLLSLLLALVRTIQTGTTADLTETVVGSLPDLHADATKLALTVEMPMKHALKLAVLLVIRDLLPLLPQGPAPALEDHLRSHSKPIAGEKKPVGMSEKMVPLVSSPLGVLMQTNALSTKMLAWPTPLHATS